MAGTYTAPGVYIEEIPSGVRTIVGVATSITAFVGRAIRGDTTKARTIHSWAEFEREYGGLWRQSGLGYAVRQYFLNGGKDAIIARVAMTQATSPAQAAAAASVDLGGTPALILEASSEGAWGKNLWITIDHETRSPDDRQMFNLQVLEAEPDPEDTSIPGATLRKESFLNVSVDPQSPRFVKSVLQDQSSLVRIEQDDLPGERPAAVQNEQLQGGFDDSDDPAIESSQESLYTKAEALLDHVDLFNLMCLPPLTRDGEIEESTFDLALTYCVKRRAMLIADPPVAWDDPAAAKEGKAEFLDSQAAINAAVFFPRIKTKDPLQENLMREFVPCGAVAGIFARTDAQRGVWKAPAGLDATFTGVEELSYKMTEGDNGDLNPIAVNCLRQFPLVGNVIWGSRTARGADLLASEWKYIPVRRLALFLEESLFRGTQWVVFEPNDEPLWAKIRLNVGTFMMSLFRQGAFQGSSPRDAFYVKCDKDTTTADDQNKGIVNIEVGFAPLKPAEFVVIKIQQIQAQSLA